MGDTTPGNNTERRLKAAERATKAMKMRAARATWDDIAKECGYGSKGSAHKAVQRELAKLPKVAAAELRQTELESLDLLEARLFAQALKGSLGAVDRIVKLKSLRYDLTGLREAQDETGVVEVMEALAAWRSDVVQRVEAREQEATETPDSETETTA